MSLSIFLVSNRGPHTISVSAFLLNLSSDVRVASGSYFFFQAEDGIRDDLVTGVQTCALPICMFGVIPAEYNVFAWEDIEQGAADDEDFRKPFDTLGTKVKLSEGSKESVQLTEIGRASCRERV